ncbi:hypothetical protein ACTXT7_006313 [Hymenolepis weldensis]
MIDRGQHLGVTTYISVRLSDSDIYPRFHPNIPIPVKHPPDFLHFSSWSKFPNAASPTTFCLRHQSFLYIFTKHVAFFCSVFLKIAVSLIIGTKSVVQQAPIIVDLHEPEGQAIRQDLLATKVY